MESMIWFTSVGSLIFPVPVQVAFGFSGFPPTSINIKRWTGYTKLSLGVKDCGSVCASALVPCDGHVSYKGCIYPPQAWCFLDRLKVHCNPGQDKVHDSNSSDQKNK